MEARRELRGVCGALWPERTRDLRDLALGRLRRQKISRTHGRFSEDDARAGLRRSSDAASSGADADLSLY